MRFLLWFWCFLGCVWISKAQPIGKNAKGIGSLNMLQKIKTATQKSDESKVSFKEFPKESRIEVWVGNRFFTAYTYVEPLKKPVLWPICTHTGREITRGYPLKPKGEDHTDHPHHIGLWFNHGNVNGHDYWNNSNLIGPEHIGPFGKVVHKGYKVISEGIIGVLACQMDWVDSKGDVVLKESTLFKFTGKDSLRTIERITTLKAVSDKVVFKDNKEGLLGLRVGTPFEKNIEEKDKGGVYTSSQGIQGDSVWGKRASFVALDANLNGKQVQVVIYDHPLNPNYPGHWHARGYGLFGLNNLGSAIFTRGKEHLNFTLKKDQEQQFTYRVEIREGKIASMDLLRKTAAEFGSR